VTPSNHRLFRAAWWGANLLLSVSFLALLLASGWEYSVRRYLDGFSDAIVPASLPSEEKKAEALLAWMRAEPMRAVAEVSTVLPTRDPQFTLNYQQLLRACGTATNAFLNLARLSDLRVRRLLLLSRDGRAKHVVAEILIGGRWVVADPSYRTLLRDARGRLLTRNELQDPAIFRQAISQIPGYPPEYDYSRFAHVRLERLPFVGSGLRRLFDSIYPNWDEALDWSLILERRSFAALLAALLLTVSFFLLRQLLAWYADRRLRIPRFHVRRHLLRAGATFFTSPEIK